MDERRFGQNIAALRRALPMTQEALADRLRVSAQAISKWENGRSLPETALLPALAAALGVEVGQLFRTGGLRVVEARLGDGLGAVDVTARLNRLIDGDCLALPAEAALLGVAAGERPRYLVVRYQAAGGECRAWAAEGEWLRLSADDRPAPLPKEGLAIVAGRYGSAGRHCDALPRIEHFGPFHWREYRADHELFPSDPANDGAEYLTLLYENAAGLHLATCAEGERLAYTEAGDHLARRRAEDGRLSHCEARHRIQRHGRLDQPSQQLARVRALQRHPGQALVAQRRGRQLTEREVELAGARGVGRIEWRAPLREAYQPLARGLGVRGVDDHYEALRGHPADDDVVDR